MKAPSSTTFSVLSKCRTGFHFLHRGALHPPGKQGLYPEKVSAAATAFLSPVYPLDLAELAVWNTSVTVTEQFSPEIVPFFERKGGRELLLIGKPQKSSKEYTNRRLHDVVTSGLCAFWGK